MLNLSNSWLFDLNQTIAKDLFEKEILPWEVLPLLNKYILQTGKLLSTDLYTEIKPNVWVSKDAIIAESACIIGPAIIGANTEVRHNAYIRENVIIGDNCVIGNSTELKNCVLFNNVKAPHFNYVGDSILGYNVQLGASVILANTRLDKEPVTIRYSKNGYRVASGFTTGLKKLGSIVGDNCRIGAGTILNPGTILEKYCYIEPLMSIDGIWVPSIEMIKRFKLMN